MSDDCKVYVGSLSYSTNDDSLTQHFEQIGTVTEAKVIVDRETRRSRGFGFVTFEDPDSAVKAIDKLNDTDLDGRQIKVSKANSRSGGGGGGFQSRGRRGGGGGAYGGGRGYGGGGGGYGGNSYGGGNYGGGGGNWGLGNAGAYGGSYPY